MSFDLSSTTSSDDASVVDISALLPDKTKGASSLLFDSSSTVDRNDDDAIVRQKDLASDKNVTDLKEKNSAKSSLEGSDKKDIQNKGCQDTIRVVMGESVKNWRRQRQSSPRRTSVSTPTRISTKAKPISNEGTVPIHGNEISPGNAKQPSYIVIQQRDSSTKVTDASNQIEFEESRLEVQPSVSGSIPRVDILEASDNYERRYTAKTVKRQFSQNGNQTPLTSSGFVDCIAVWDPQRQVYRLEIPELIASNIGSVLLSPNEQIAACRKNREQQQKQAEAQRQDNRKRRRL